MLFLQYIEFYAINITVLHLSGHPQFFFTRLPFVRGWWLSIEFGCTEPSPGSCKVLRRRAWAAALKRTNGLHIDHRTLKFSVMSVWYRTLDPAPALASTPLRFPPCYVLPP